MKTTRRSVLRGALAGTAAVALTRDLKPPEASADPIIDPEWVAHGDVYHFETGIDYRGEWEERSVWYSISDGESGEGGLGKLVYDGGWKLLR